MNHFMTSKRKKKDSPIVAFVIGGILLLLGIFAAVGSLGSAKQADRQTSSGKLTISESSWNIGEVSMKDGLNEKVVTLKNETDSPVTVTEMETSCMCTKATIRNADGTMGPTKGMVGHGGTPRMSQTIAPGETAELIVVFDPNAHGPNAVGPITRDIMLKTDSSLQPTIGLRFRGIVTK